MPLIVENGTGIANADSWVSVGDHRAYWSARGHTEVADATDEQLEADLRNAADYLILAFRWPGQPTTIGQRLPWPRAGVPSGSGYFPSNGIPTQVISAQMVLAVEARAGTPLLLKPVAGDRVVIEETKSAKGFSKSTKYATPPIDGRSGLVRFPVVDQILRGIYTGSSDGSFAVVPVRRTL